MQQLTLERMAMGAIQTRFAEAVDQVAANLQDRRTDAEAKRKIVIEVTFDPIGINRNQCQVVAKVGTKLAAPLGVPTSVAIGADENGVITAREQVQLPLFEEPVARKDKIQSIK